MNPKVGFKVSRVWGLGVMHPILLQAQLRYMKCSTTNYKFLEDQMNPFSWGVIDPLPLASKDLGVICPILL